MEAVKFMGLLGADLQQGSTQLHCAFFIVFVLFWSYVWS